MLILLLLLQMLSLPAQHFSGPRHTEPGWVLALPVAGRHAFGRKLIWRSHTPIGSQSHKP